MKGIVDRPMTKALCDASSIIGIRASKHTLEMIECLNDHSTVVVDCLKLNTNASKSEVIKTKIGLRFCYLIICQYCSVYASRSVKLVQRGNKYQSTVSKLSNIEMHS